MRQGKGDVRQGTGNVRLIMSRCFPGQRSFFCQKFYFFLITSLQLQVLVMMCVHMLLDKVFALKLTQRCPGQCALCTVPDSTQLVLPRQIIRIYTTVYTRDTVPSRLFSCRQLVNKLKFCHLPKNRERKNFTSIKSSHIILQLPHFGTTIQETAMF